MIQRKSELLQLALQSFERASERDWATRGQIGQLSAEEACNKVAVVFERQSLNRMNSKDLGAKVHDGILGLQVVFKSLPPTEDEICDAIVRSKSDYMAFQALRVLALLKFAPESAALKAWHTSLTGGLAMEPALPKGPSQFRDVHRNMLIVGQIRQLQKCGFHPTRNEATDHSASGCDIVADALATIGSNLSYSAVERVWKNRDAGLQYDYIAELCAEALKGITREEDASD